MDRSTQRTASCILLARAGQPDALGALFDKYRNYFRLLATTCLHRDLRRKADPSDVVQETFLKAHAGFDEFRGSSEQEWTAWVRRILVRSLMDLQRRYAVPGRDVARERSLEAVLDRSS